MNLPNSQELDCYCEEFWSLSIITAPAKLKRAKFIFGNIASFGKQEKVFASEFTKALFGNKEKVLVEGTALSKALDKSELKHISVLIAIHQG